MTRRSSLLLSVGAALVAALVVAAISLATQGSRDDNPKPGKAANGNVADPRVGTAMADPELAVSGVHTRVLGPIAMEARTPDPLGGPDWVVRVATTETVAPGRGGRMHASQAGRCAQLGRIVGGRFGWVDGGNVFHPVPIESTLLPLVCGSTTPDLDHEPALDVANRITDPSSPNAHLIQTVAWGLAGASAQSTVTIDGAAHDAPASPDGAFVVPVAASASRPVVHLAVRYGDGRTASADSSYRADAIRTAPGFAALPVTRGERTPTLPDPGSSAAVDARYPDPDGGLPHGILAIRCGGEHWCPSEVGRVVGRRVGGVREPAGLFIDTQASGNFGLASPNPLPTRRRPLVVMTGSGIAEDETVSSARRNQPGETTIDGVADPSVRSITIVSPRDTRTIVPSPRTHSFAAVYDGRFPTGRFAITARLANGRTFHEGVASPEYP